jgi:hypothetical protein
MSRFGFAIVAVVIALAAADAAAAPPFMCGVAGADVSLHSAVQLRRDLGATHVRRYMLWRYAQGQVSADDFEFNLTVAAVKRDPARYVDAWSRTVPDWAELDAAVDTVCADLDRAINRTITPVLEVFEGTVFGLPLLSKGAMGPRDAASASHVGPCSVGVSSYLAHSYRWVRAVLQRYIPRLRATCGAASSILVQIENEFNEAALSVFAGQREFCERWFNMTFLTQSLATLRDAAKDAESAAGNGTVVLVTQNLHTDVPKAFHDVVLPECYYVRAARLWDRLIDVWSFDAYPNLVDAWPLRAHVLGERLRNITRVVAPGKSVFVMESGYPSLAREFAHPDNASVINWSESRQAAYADAAVSAVQRAGGAGLFWFNVIKTQGMRPPAGGYRPSDAEVIRELRTLVSTRNITHFVDWALVGDHLAKLIIDAPFFLVRADAQHGWGLLNLDGTPKPAFRALASAFQRAASSP